MSTCYIPRRYGQPSQPRLPAKVERDKMNCVSDGEAGALAVKLLAAEAPAYKQQV
ncbi:hypothetical protein DVH05_009393 [Phytophthora capsici]|nr:hypothetical protein DVH05_009393 [Phytophthora capsici]